MQIYHIELIYDFDNVDDENFIPKEVWKILKSMHLFAINFLCQGNYDFKGKINALEKENKKTKNYCTHPKTVSKLPYNRTYSSLCSEGCVQAS